MALSGSPPKRPVQGANQLTNALVVHAYPGGLAAPHLGLQQTGKTGEMFIALLGTFALLLAAAVVVLG